MLWALLWDIVLTCASSSTDASFIAETVLKCFINAFAFFSPIPSIRSREEVNDDF